MKTRNKQFVTVLCSLLLSAISAVAQNDGSKSQIAERVIHSKNFEGNKIGVSADRKLVVYLPAGYNGESKRYPVLYFSRAQWMDIGHFSIRAARRLCSTAQSREVQFAASFLSLWR